ncbi:MAG: hypothetical protein P1U86_15675 [Verrucomicrobiales bacterium]|nr:hypothetical protein [Verrucomicrobiales bacterium]
MKQFIAIMVAIVFAAGSVYAGCGKKTTVTGTFEYNEDDKVLTVEGVDKGIKLQATTKITDAEGKEASIDDLDGKKIEVVHEHNKADSVTIAKAS